MPSNTPADFPLPSSKKGTNQFRFGEYYQPGECYGQTAYLRAEFVDDLDNPRNWSREVQSKLAVWRERLSSLLDAIPHDALRLQNIPKAMATWADEFHLNCDWFTSIVLTERWGGPIADELSSERDRVAFEALLSVPSPALPLEACPSGEFRLTHPGFDLTVTTRQEVETSLCAAFKKAYARYERAFEERARQDGWQKTPPMRDGAKRSFRTPFRLLVEYHCLERSYATIAADHRMSESEVRKAVSHASKRLALTLHKARHPRKKPSARRSRRRPVRK